MVQSPELPYPMAMLAFDHRSVLAQIFGEATGRTVDGETAEEFRQAKTIVVDALLAVRRSVPAGMKPALLIDERYGQHEFDRLRQFDLALGTPAEKSMEPVFTFEHGGDFAHAIQRQDPTFVKALVFYSQGMDGETVDTQMTRLRTLTRTLDDQGRPLMLEVLVEPSAHEVTEGIVGPRFDELPRAEATVQAVRNFHTAGIEPAVWKLEGFDDPRLYRMVFDACLEGADGVAFVVLGRGQDTTAVARWLSAAAAVPGCRGFAVGRTIWQEPLSQMWRGELDRPTATEAISRNYLHLCSVFDEHRHREHVN